ncbi:hypothetical protein [Roseibium sp.]|uniref:hypothetical protein n=1 Tax=Roseibium sp. TaxID=1936156 RepID=UPI0032979AD5
MLPAVGLAATAAIEAYEYKSWSGENPEGGLDDYAAFRMDQLEQLAVSSKGKVELAARWAGETGGEIVDWSSETLEIGLVWSSTIVYGGANWTAQNAKSASSWAGETGLSAYSWATETMSQVGASWD